MTMPITDASAARLATAICLLSPVAKKYSAPETTSPIIPSIPTIDNKNCNTFESISAIGVASVITPAASTVSIREKVCIFFERTSQLTPKCTAH